MRIDFIVDSVEENVNAKIQISFTCLFFFSSEEREKNGNTFNNNIIKLPVRSCSYFLLLMLNKFIIAMLAIK